MPDFPFDSLLPKHFWSLPFFYYKAVRGLPLWVSLITSLYAGDGVWLLAIPSLCWFSLGLSLFAHILSFNPLSPLFWWCIEGISNLHKIQPLLNDGSGFESKRPCGSAGKESTWNVGDLGLIPGLGRSSGEGKGYLLQYSGLESSMNCIVHGVAKSWTWQRLSLHFKLLFCV